MKNTLFYGDNLEVMSTFFGKDAVDLIYLDPPFNSDETYNLMYRNMTGRPVPESVEAFTDTWSFDDAKRRIARAMPEMMREQGIAAEFAEFWQLWVRALEKANPRLLAYLIYMTQRLLQMWSMLRPTGSIYVHCDPTASHYIKVVMDAIFQHKNFRNEISWKRTGSHGGSRRWGPVHDTILFYTKGDKYTWNNVYQSYDPSYIEKAYRNRDADGRRYQVVSLTGAGVRSGESGEAWRGVDPSAVGRHWAVPMKSLQRAYPETDLSSKGTHEKLDLLDEAGLVYWPKRGEVPRHKRYVDENPGVLVQDVITDISALSATSAERLGYPTQKPSALLERIIRCSSNPGDVVFDPFCGCGTTIYAAERTGRKWYGCDIAILPIQKIREELRSKKYGLTEGVNFEVEGVPNSVESATELWKRDPFQFQHWFVELVKGYPMARKVADGGIDGKLYFSEKGPEGSVILEVKGGHVGPAVIRALTGVVVRENAAMGALLTLKNPTPRMRVEADDAGTVEIDGRQYPRIQILSVEEYFEQDKRLNVPVGRGAHLTEMEQPALPF